MVIERVAKVAGTHLTILTFTDALFTTDGIGAQALNIQCEFRDRLRETGCATYDRSSESPVQRIPQYDVLQDECIVV